MKKTIAVTILLLIVIVSLLPAGQITGGGTLSVGWGLYNKEKAKAMGPTAALYGNAGYDFNKSLSAFGEASIVFFSPTIQKSNFINVRSGAGLAVGGGSAWTFDGGFSVSASTGVYFERFDNGIIRYESGMYVTVKPKFLVFPIERVGDFFNLQIALPCSLYMSGSGCRIVVSAAIGFDCSEYGRRNK